MMLSLGYAGVTRISLQTIYIIRSKTKKYIPFANNGENDYV